MKRAEYFINAILTGVDFSTHPLYLTEQYIPAGHKDHNIEALTKNFP
jgi:hypothetical protein